jgi:hypothetical protein
VLDRPPLPSTPVTSHHRHDLSLRVRDTPMGPHHRYDEVRFAVSGTQLNAPILVTTVAALFLVLFWKCAELDLT